jgi:hypothetical protein
VIAMGQPRSGREEEPRRPLRCRNGQENCHPFVGRKMPPNWAVPDPLLVKPQSLASWFMHPKINLKSDTIIFLKKFAIKN